MQTLKPISLEDREWVSDLMWRSNSRGSEYTFSNLYNWSKVYHFRIGRIEDFLIIQSGNTTHRYNYPIGFGDVRTAITVMMETCKKEGMAFRLYGINEQAKEALEIAYPNSFSFQPVRNNFDYIYLREKLATLTGKKLHGKRNHIARFKENHPDWCYEPLSDENLNEVGEMNQEWCRINGCYDDPGLRQEACAVRSALENYHALKLTGGALRADGKIIAFTLGSPVAEDTFVVHVEKAFGDIQGAYPMINQQFVLNELEKYTYVNREDDLGDEGLRKAKESYYPDMMYARYVLTPKEPG